MMAMMRVFTKIYLTYGLIDFNSMTTHQRVFYTSRLGDCVHCTFTFTFSVQLFHKIFFPPQNSIKYK